MKRILYLFLILAAFTACSEDLLNVKNPNTPTTGTFWKNSSDAQKGLTATYSEFTRYGLWGRWIYFKLDVTGDEATSTSGYNLLAAWTRFIYSDPNFVDGSVATWHDFYKQVFEANQVVAYSPSIVPANSNDATVLKQIIAQAKFIRAFDYFYLYILYGSRIPIVLAPSNPSDKYPVGDSTTVYNIIKKDLYEAYPDLPEFWAGADKGRVTQGAALALLGKVFMQQHQWDSAVWAFKPLVEGNLKGYYGLMDNYMDNFTHYKENNKESVFEIQFSDVVKEISDDHNGGYVDDDDPSQNIGNNRSQFTAIMGWPDIDALPWVVKEYKKEKPDNPDSLFDSRLNASVLYRTISGGDTATNFTDFPGTVLWGSKSWSSGWPARNYTINKYTDSYFATSSNYWSPINYRVIRYADVLLCYAECLAQLDRVTDAVVYVDMVRQRPSTNLKKLSESIYKNELSSKERFLKRLQMERELELSYESVRWIDLKRWGLLDNQTGINELTSRDADFSNFRLGISGIMPIPQSEVDNNPNYQGKNNSGY